MRSRQRLGKRRCRVTPAKDGFKHSMEDEIEFRTEEAAKLHWRKTVAGVCRADLSYVLEIERRERVFRAGEAAKQLQEIINQPAIEVLAVVEPAKPQRPPKPERIFGKVWFWFKDQWVSVPPACHPSDDWQVRCQAVLDGATRFVFAGDRTVNNGPAQINGVKATP